jgi:hypothetical protein
MVDKTFDKPEMSTITGTWESFRGDFLVKYKGTRRFSSVAYLDKIGKKGLVQAAVWLDKNQNSYRDPGEQVVATFKAKAEVVYYDLDFYSKESGKIEADKKAGTFRLFHEGDAFANGTILSKDFFF